METGLIGIIEVGRYKGSLPPLIPTAKPLSAKRVIRSRAATKESSFYVEEQKRAGKVVGWDEATQSRPPLQIDMEGPSPCSYSPRNKPLYETNAPAWTIGKRSFIDRSGGARRSWEKSWFHDENVWTNKVDFHTDRSWPNPTVYEKKSLIGPKQTVVLEAPSFSIGRRRDINLNKPGSEKEPAPNDYNTKPADKVLMKKEPSFSLQFRRGGTCLWSSKELTPGPAAYKPAITASKPRKPAYSIRGVRRDNSIHELGPYAAN